MDWLELEGLENLTEAMGAMGAMHSHRQSGRKCE